MNSVASLVCIAPLVLAGTLAASGGGRPAVATDVASRASTAADSVPEGLAASDWSSIRAAYEAGRHGIVAVAGESGAESCWTARNHGQSMNTTFDERGFTTRPDVGSWSWGLDLQSYGWDLTRSVTTPCATSADGGRLSRVWDDCLTEWYVNDSRGLEHGFTVASRPSIADAPLTVDLSIRGGLQPVVSLDGRNVAFTDAQGAAALNYNGLTVFDAAGKTVTARWCAIGNDRLRLQVDDAKASYPLTIDPVVQQAYLKASNTGAADSFGYSVAVSGDTLVVGARFEDSNATGVNGNQSNNSATDSGAAYVFVRSGGAWSQQAYLKASNTGVQDYFGDSVAVSGDTVVVGARFEDSNATGVNGNQADNSASQSGAAYVFVRSGDVWSQQAYLKASNSELTEVFGTSVAVSGDTVVVGGPWEDSNATGVNGNQADNSASASGAAYVFTLPNPNTITYCTAGTSTNGCVPSIGSTGSPSIAATSGFSINVANVEGQKQGLLFYGVSGRTATVWGSGGNSFQCVKAPTQRMQSQNSGGTSGLCDGVLSTDGLAYLATHPSALGQPFAAGTTVNAQAWYRDPPAVKSTNLSDALEFVTQP